MPYISNDIIRELYELYGNDYYPVEQYCIGCGNCEHYGFPCMNCATHVFGGHLGIGNVGAIPMDIDINVDMDIVNDNDIENLPPTPPITDTISSTCTGTHTYFTDSSSDEGDASPEPN